MINQKHKTSLNILSMRALNVAKDMENEYKLNGGRMQTIGDLLRYDASTFANYKNMGITAYIHTILTLHQLGLDMKGSEKEIPWHDPELEISQEFRAANKYNCSLTFYSTDPIDYALDDIDIDEMGFVSVEHFIFNLYSNLRSTRLDRYESIGDYLIINLSFATSNEIIIFSNNKQSLLSFITMCRVIKSASNDAWEIATNAAQILNNI